MSSFEDEALQIIVRSYTREAGVSNLEREIAAVCRAIAQEVAEGKTEKTIVVGDDVHKFLGPIKHYSEVAERTKYSGVATGLAWTSDGRRHHLHRGDQDEGQRAVSPLPASWAM